MQAEILVDGGWVPTSESFPVHNPYTGAVVGMAGRASADDVRAAAAAAKRYRASLSGHERARILEDAARAVLDGQERFAVSIVAESGVALKDARREVQRAANYLRACSEEATRLGGETIGTDVTSTSERRLALTVREPVGLIAVLTPFNRPLNQVVVKVAPALASNNTVILKPSEKTPLTALLFARTLLEAGLPPQMLSVVTGDPEEVAEALFSSGMLDMVTFTGSAEVGQRIAARLGMVRSVFELGDNGALLVMDDADLELAVRYATAGAFSTAGQSCRGVKRLLVHERVAEPFSRLLAAQARELLVGDPMDPSTDIGTLITEDAAIQVEERVEDAVRRGATILAGGARKGAQYEPTVLDSVARDAPLVVEETFGPCAPIIRVRDLDDALDYANSSRFGLQAGIFTRDLGAALRAARELEVGAVIINGGPQFESPNIPFGGVKLSGIGREGARFAMQEMTTIKTIVL